MTTPRFGHHQREIVSSNIRGLKQTFNARALYYIAWGFVFGN